MNKEIFKLSAIVEQDPLDDNLMSMVMGGAGGGDNCSSKYTCCLAVGCNINCKLEPCKFTN